MSEDHMFNQLYHVHNAGTYSDDEDSEIDEPDSHQLDHPPQSFLHMSNSDFDGPFSSNNICQFTPVTDGNKRTIIIPEISRRCLMRWPVGAKLASGRGAVVYNVDCGDAENPHKCTKVARISQLRTKQDTTNFTRDVQARYLLSCQCSSIQITGLIDAFMCTTKTKTFGVTISDQYDGTLIKHLLTLSSNERREFVKYVQKTLESMISKMHACGIVHRDLHHGNILLQDQPGDNPVIALTDFESALGDYFETSVRVFSAYVHSDNSALLAIIAELETVCQYLDSEIDTLDIHMLDALGIALSDLHH
jgi:serine/threonine protein kinase